MKKLTRAEEEVMLVLWRLKEAVVRDIISELKGSGNPLYHGLHCGKGT